MTKLALPIAAALAGSAMLAPMPASAQSSTAEIIVYGNDPCPRSTDDNVVVCYRKPETERYRIPEQFRTGGTRQQREAWANKARRVEMAGRTGIQSCSPVGPAGYTGCLDQLINENQAQAREEADAQAPPEQ
jgi:hypothetical protein